MFRPAMNNRSSSMVRPLSRALEASQRAQSYRYPSIPRPKRNFLYYANYPNVSFQLYRPYSTKASEKAKVKSKRGMLKWVAVASISFILYGFTTNVQTTAEDDTDEKKKKPVKFSNSWAFFCYSTLPLNALSRLWGQVNSIVLPVWMRAPGYKLYSYAFGVNLDEMKDPELTHYRNLSEFFYRELKDGARVVDERSDIVCPSDGKVLQMGIIHDGEIEQVKGMTYSVDKFLGSHSKLAAPAHEVDFETDLAVQERHKEFASINNISYTLDDILGGEGKNVTHLRKVIYKDQGDMTAQPSTADKQVLKDVIKGTVDDSEKELYFAVIYLAPGDYHRYHSPANWVCQMRRHFVGELYSVAPYFQRTLENLFVLNERVALLGYWKHGFFSMTPVGATNVGSIKVNFDKELTTNTKFDCKNTRLHKNSCYEANYSRASPLLNGFPLGKGQEVGGFMLGSTVVLAFEAPKSFKFSINVGDSVRMGQPLGSCT